jgi:hypothetical protein
MTSDLPLLRIVVMRYNILLIGVNSLAFFGVFGMTMKDVLSPPG